MKTPVLEPTSAAKAGWVIILLTVGWLVFVLLPGSAEKPAAKLATIPLPLYKLQQVGLRDNPDWDGLPEIFAIWADKAEWKGNWTRFAYWNPTMKDYSYYFEATKVEGVYRFKEIPAPKPPSDYWPWDESLGDECPIRFYRTPIRWPLFPAKLTRPAKDMGEVDPAKAKVEVEIVVPKIAVPDVRPIPVEPTPKP